MLCRYLKILTLIVTLLLFSGSEGSYYSEIIDEHTLGSVSYALRSKLKGRVYARDSPEYNALRPVHNGGCRHIYPALIVRPRSTYEVSTVVKVAKEYGMEISVRSGGHSYQCQGTKHNSINIDMRSIKHVKLVSPHEAILGAGNTWKRVLEYIHPDHYTLVHGQCSRVGVGGYLLGLGTNLISISAKHGLGADNVIEHTMVLADGSIAKVGHYNTTLLDHYYKPSQVIQHGYDNDLRFALRSSGSSYGITTEFRYKVYPYPEHFPMVIPVYIEDAYDLHNIQRASERGRFGFYLFESYYFRRTSPTHFLSAAYQILPRILRALSGRRTEPMFIALADLKAHGRKGNLRNGLNFLKYHGIKLALDIEGLYRATGLDAFDLTYDDIETGYLTEDQMRREGYATLHSANFWVHSTKAFDDTFIHHPLVGRKAKITDRGKISGCDFCIWFIAFQNPYKPFDPIPGQDTGLIASHLECTSNPNYPYKAEQCGHFIKEMKLVLTEEAHAAGEEPIQYVNTPSCDKYGPSFSERYWGVNYPRLLKIKEYWDPHNVFNHCQSVGSTDEDCCPN